MTSKVDFTSPTPQLTRKGDWCYIVHGDAMFIPEDRIDDWRGFMNLNTQADKWYSLADSKESDFTLIEDYYGNA